MKRIITIIDTENGISVTADDILTIDELGSVDLNTNTPAKLLGEFLCHAATVWLDTQHLDVAQISAYIKSITVDQPILN